jgi:glycosyltransferase involved in cell wall biosynthesis
MIARFNVHKNHIGLIKALKTAFLSRSDLIIILAGEGVSSSNTVLVNTINETGFADNFRLLGHRDDVRSLLSAIDVYVSSSIGESFPNILGEALLCEKTCLATDVGESREIVGCGGIIVEVHDALSLAKGLDEIISYERKFLDDLGARGRQHIMQKYSISSTAKHYACLYKDLAYKGKK